MEYDAQKLMVSDFPANLNQFIGQEKAIETLLIAIFAARRLAAALPHTMIYGPPGLGKTTIATCTAKTLGVPIYYAIGSKISAKKDVDEAVEFVSSRVNAMMFIDEVHAIPKKIEELFFPIMQDFIHDGHPIPKFTMFGATTNAGDVIKPMRDRFKYTLRLDHYTSEAIQEILLNNELMEPEAAILIAKRSFGIPRIAKNYLIHCRDQAIFNHPDDLTTRVEDVDMAMDRLGVDEEGIDPTQRQILRYLLSCGIPVGVETIAMALDIELANLKELHERVLMYKELMIRGPRGRTITEAGIKYLKSKGDI